MMYCTVFGIVFLGIGVMFYTGNALHWVRGWRAMPESERANIRVVPLCRNLSAPFFLAGALFLAGGLIPAFGERGLRFALVGWLALCWADVVYISKSGRYVVDGKARRP